MLLQTEDRRRCAPPQDVRGVDAALALLPQLSRDVPAPGSGSTAERWDLLSRLAGTDLVVARVAEAHLDALAILAEAEAHEAHEADKTDEADRTDGAARAGAGVTAGVTAEVARRLGADERSTWGVYAAEGPQSTLRAVPDGVGGYRLSGVKPWCSLAGRLSHALVTARTGTQRQLFAVRLGTAVGTPARAPGVSVRTGGWHARGLAAVPSEPVDLLAVPAVPVGGPGWYLERPGFAYGGLGVAACWYGALARLVDATRTAAGERPPDQLALWHLGADDLDQHLARCALDHAATEVDAGRATGPAGQALALRTRSVVADAAERVITRSGHARGPAPLALDDEHAQRVADLTLYLRQHHAERDVAALGAMVHERGPAPR